MRSQSMPSIAIANVTHHYGDRRALNAVTIDIAAAEVFGLLGPNGGGKSTLLRLLSTLLPLQQGSISLAGHDVAREPDAVRRAIGVTFQSPSLDIKLTVQENLKYQGHLYGLQGRALRDRMAQVMSQLKIQDRAGDIVQTLSGGLKRRVEIAKSLLHAPQVLLLDEPSTGLDPGARHDLWQFLTTLRSETGVTVLVTTHLMEEADRCDRLGLLDQGDLIALGTPDELRSSVGGDSITIDPVNLTELQQQLQDTLHLQARPLGNQLRIENVSGPEVVERLARELPGTFRSLTLGKPTLDDAFIHLTGRRLADEIGAE
ncbi:MAG: ATP-binding cassette domain-containing protein [Planctomycetaceae bacterium]|nr:ATP-binding cassette domain-containing protein [Planctomycetaceae bacterium]